MGCACSSGLDERQVTQKPYYPESSRPANRSVSAPEPSRGYQPSDSVKRRLQAEAAERRALEQANRGMGDPKKAKQLSESVARQELIGKITAQYQLRGLDAPMGLGLASLEQLREHYDRVTNGLFK